MGKKEIEFIEKNLGNMKKLKYEDYIIFEIIFYILMIIIFSTVIIIGHKQNRNPKDENQKIERQEEQIIRDNQPQLWR